MTRKLERLDPDSVIQNLNGWGADLGRPAIHKRFSFTDFAQAFAFMTEIAGIAERLDHHPEWTNVYSRVDMVLTTHDAGGVTQLDIDLARAADAAAARFS